MKQKKTKKAFDVLWETRDNLLRMLIEDVVEKEGVLTGDSGYDGALGFEYQEIDNKFMGRLASLNTFLHNLSPAPQGQTKRTGVTNRVEVVRTTPDDLERDLNAALKKHPKLKLVSTAMKKGEEGGLIVLLAFTSP
ncbi:MAG: hypothetical protein ACYTHN_01160 [Planctomycetota bacterium]|jgi:hypothetical protein